MKKYKFTKGILNKITNEYYNLTLFSGENVIYKATITSNEACKLVNKHNNIIIE
jgi:hypothetical protein